MNRRVRCHLAVHLVVEDIPGPNGTVDRTIVVDQAPCDCYPNGWDAPARDETHRVGSDAP